MNTFPSLFSERSELSRKMRLPHVTAALRLSLCDGIINRGGTAILSPSESFAFGGLFVCRIGTRGCVIREII